jgi:hypothetical protein
MSYWDTYVDKAISGPRKSILKGVETRRKKALEKKETEQKTLHRMWSKWRNERLQAICEGPHGVEALGLVTFLDGMTFNDGEELLVRAEMWKTADPDTRFQVLSLIDGAICEMRERAGMEFVDDAMPFSDEPLNVFLIIREMLR